jgi:hypothetical protein
MVTSYVYTEVDIGQNLSLYIDGNSKITINNGSYDNPTPNALSLPHISTCPGSTSICRKSCYVYNLQNNAPEVYSKYMQNERVLHHILMNNNLISLTAENLGIWISINCKYGFRWHVSGDIISKQHAEWIVKITEASPKVLHWIYTRSFEVVPILVTSKNLSVNISADSENYTLAKQISQNNNVRICYFTPDGNIPNDLNTQSVIFPDYNFRGRDPLITTGTEWFNSLSPVERKMVCPADFFGQSENHRCGPCKKCLKVFGK